MCMSAGLCNKEDPWSVLLLQTPKDVHHAPKQSLLGLLGSKLCPARQDTTCLLLGVVGLLKGKAAQKTHCSDTFEAALGSSYLFVS